MSRDRSPSETNEHHVNDLSNAVIKIWMVKIDVSQIHRHVNPLDRTKARIDDGLLLQMSNKVNGDAFAARVYLCDVSLARLAVQERTIRRFLVLVPLVEKADKVMKCNGGMLSWHKRNQSQF